MLYLLVVILAVGLLIWGKGRDEIFRDWGGGLLILIIGIYIITFTIALYVPSSLQSSYVKLQAQRQYISSFPQVPVPIEEALKEIQDQSQNGIGINIDLVNQQLAVEVIKYTLQYWDKVEHYNRSIFFWRQHSNLDLMIWGYPRVAKHIAKLGLQPILP